MLIRLGIFVALLCSAAMSHKLRIERTPQTLEAARHYRSNKIRKAMNDSVDPCENFYEFACGNWNDVPNSFQGSLKQFRPLLSELLEAQHNDKDTEIDKIVKTFYRSCVTAGFREQNSEKLRAIVSEFGKMPLLEGDQWLADDFDWLTTVAKISNKYGIQIIFGYEIKADEMNHSANAMYLTKPKDNRVSLSKIEGDLRISLRCSRDEAELVAKEIYDFQAQQNGGNESNDAKNLTTFDELQNKYLPNLDVKKLINISFGTLPSSTVYETHPSHGQTVIDAIQRTPKRTVANYIFYQLIRPFVLRYLDYNSGYQSAATTKTLEYFGPAVSNMFYRAYSLQEKKTQYQHMWLNIKRRAKAILESDSFDWCDFESRAYAVAKLQAMELKIFSYEKNNFAENYAQLNLSIWYTDNIKEILASQAIKTRASLTEPTQSMPNELNFKTFGYFTGTNTIVLPVSVLEADFLLSAFNPQAVDFGKLGFYLAQQLLRGLSDTGRFESFLSNGQTKDSAKETESGNVELVKCFSHQYQNYTRGGKALPQQEMQIDNGGLRMAYEAYLVWLEDQERTQPQLELETLPELNYTAKQLFFLSFAQMWCNDVEAEKWRVIVPLTNLQEFATEFQCPLGSAMNPPKKCQLF